MLSISLSDTDTGIHPPTTTSMDGYLHSPLHINDEKLRLKVPMRIDIVAAQVRRLAFTLRLNHNITCAGRFELCPVSRHLRCHDIHLIPRIPLRAAWRQVRFHRCDGEHPQRRGQNVVWRQKGEHAVFRVEHKGCFGVGDDVGERGNVVGGSEPEQAERKARSFRDQVLKELLVGLACGLGFRV